MNMHKSARLTPRGRERIVRQVESVGAKPARASAWVAASASTRNGRRDREKTPRRAGAADRSRIARVLSIALACDFYSFLIALSSSLTVAWWCLIDAWRAFLRRCSSFLRFLFFPEVNVLRSTVSTVNPHISLPPLFSVTDAV